MLLCTTCTLPFLKSFNTFVRKLSMSVLFAMLLGREFPMLYTNRLVHECESGHEFPILKWQPA